MSLNSIYLYRNKVTVFTSADPWTNERNRQVYQRNFKVYRGVDNKLDLQVRNSDQKPYNVNGYTLVFNLVERLTQKLLISKPLTVTSAAQGQITVTLTEAELNNIHAGLYSYSVIKEVRNDQGATVSKTPLFVDSQYGGMGVIEVFGDLQGEPKESTVIDTFEKIPTYWPNDGTSNSELGYASPEVSSTDSVHTFAIYQTNYKGTIVIEASLEEGGTPAAGKWTAITPDGEFSSNIVLDGTSSTVFYKNVVGIWKWFRIKHIPATGNTGSIDKVIYR